MKEYAFGVDVGGTTVKIGLFLTDGTLCEAREIPTRTEEKGALILGDIAGAIREIAAERAIPPERIAGIGMGVPGPVGRCGTVYKSVNLGWDVFPVAQEMASLTGFPTKAANDANVAALGEMWMGSGRGYRDMVMITLGTGVGSGVVVDGRLVAGHGGSAGEIGHITVNPHETKTCGCGRCGCLEQYASANGVARAARSYLKAHDDETILRAYPAEALTSREVFDAAKEQDPVALRIVDGFGRAMARALAHVSCVVDPQIYVIGGGLAKAGEIVIDVIRKHYEAYAFYAVKETLFALAALGNQAGIYGGARMILDDQKEK